MSHLIPAYSELRELFHDHRPVKSKRTSGSKPIQWLPLDAMTLTALAAVIAWLLLIWLASATDQAARSAYPYYDTRKPVPAWNEPAPLEGNLNH